MAHSTLSTLFYRGHALRLAIASACCMALLLARATWTGVDDYGFLVWNLFLAWVPLGLSSVLTRVEARGARWPWLALLTAPWLVFLPNAPYLVTDFMHLRNHDSAPLWFDAVMLMAFAWTGLALGVSSLRAWGDVVRARVGRRIATAFIAGAALLAAYGVYLGRFVRLNSWDVVTRPVRTLTTALAPLSHPLTLQRPWMVTIALTLLFLVAYLTTMRPTERDRPSVRR